MTPNVDHVFASSIPGLYQQYLVPMLFEPYAADLAARLSSKEPRRVLETAAGTGVVTRALASALSGTIVATDLNQPMIDCAAAIGSGRPVEWRQADAMQLPFPDASFDAVVCQFGVMFFPDKVKAFAETRRVLKPGGRFLFNVWDRIGENEFADVVTNALARLFPDDPPRFLARTPYAYFDRKTIEGDLAAAGFGATPQMTTLTHRSRAPSPRAPAIALCQGSPLRKELESRGPGRLDEATDVAATALSLRFGTGPVDGKMQAQVVSIDA